MVGAGVLTLPYAMSKMGWGPGVTVLLLSWIITLFTLWQMVEMHEMVPGVRFDRYHELGQHAFGKKLGLYIICPQQLLVEVGTCIAYMVTGGKSLQKIQETLWPHWKGLRTSYWIIIFASVNFVLCQCPNFNSISAVSFAAAVMSIGYSTIAWVASLKRGVRPNVDYSYSAHSVPDGVFNFMLAMGEVAFSYAGHNVVLEIQATIPSTPDNPSKKAMWKGVIVAYLGVAFCYLPVAFIGYYVYGNSVDDNILITLERPTWLIAAANMFVIVHVIGGYQVFSMPVFDMIETFLVKQMKLPPSLILRLLARTGFVAFTMIVGICIPFFGSLLGFLGGFAFAPTSYFIPCIIWLKIFKPKRFGLSWIVNWVCIVLGVLLMILAPIGSLRQIIIQFKHYKFFS
ncbi:lysine histidine transporter-like 2 [Vicia villosa]|uniref:lysine histidine transporter-like 2 n=1 Tax=Vicia villosa TaxID=3911 RepID=UPI00273C0363|nr:lysine histidine transporter-like 2 [Vicia villosa]